MTAVWRLLEHGPVDGALNMAIDRAVQYAREQGGAPPTLRLYRWARPTATLGRFQRSDSVDLELCRNSGVDVARRFTGGRGVLHDDEITYSAVAALDDGMPRGVAASYRVLCGALVAAYRELGVDACLTERDKGNATTAACYLQTTRADVSVGAHKLSGSAQVWMGATVLQHGSFTISRDTRREAGVFRLGSSDAAALEGASRSLSELLSAAPDHEAIRAAIVRGFESALGIRLVPGELTAQESDLAAGLVDQVQLLRASSAPGAQSLEFT